MSIQAVEIRDILSRPISHMQSLNE